MLIGVPREIKIGGGICITAIAYETVTDAARENRPVVPSRTRPAYPTRPLRTHSTFASKPRIF